MLRGVAGDDGSAFNQLTAKASSWSHDTIKAVQARLKSAGYYSGLVDGKGGASLAPALKQWRLLGPPLEKADRIQAAFRRPPREKAFADMARQRHARSDWRPSAADED